MTQEQRMVREFMIEAGQDVPLRPTIPDLKTCELRLDLIDEENGELEEALLAGNIVDVADAIGDLLVVVLGAAVACGIEIKPVFDAIHASNMTKFIDGYLAENGKWIKGPSYRPVELGPILDAQT